jgi:NAD(P)-dependent dehydrogenase (short-subunit alcohol dehydrogenase family)
VTTPTRRPVTDQAVVVLGASSGIGRATALAFGRRGARVVVASRGVEALDTLVTELTALGAQAVSVPIDITDEAAVDALARIAESGSAASTPGSPGRPSASTGRSRTSPSRSSGG